MGDVSAFNEVLQLLNQQKIQPVVDTVFPMEKIQDAHGYLENGQQSGKVILVP